MSSKHGTDEMPETPVHVLTPDQEYVLSKDRAVMIANADRDAALVELVKARHEIEKLRKRIAVFERDIEQFKLAAESAFLLVKLRQFDWNVAETARVLDMPRSNLYKKIERHGLAREQG